MLVLTDQFYWQVFYFCGWVAGGSVEKLRLKLTSAEVKFEAQLGDMRIFILTIYFTDL